MNQALSQPQNPMRRAICMHELRQLLLLWLALAGICLVRPCTVRGQLNSLTEEAKIRSNPTEPSACGESMPSQSVEAALGLACLVERGGTPTISFRDAIVIGFVGGFVRRDDIKHPEVQFAALLRERYPSKVHAEVFANHDGKQALRSVLQLLDTNGDGVLTDSEKQKASIIIYGHSWGASQTVTLARDLGRQGIPVLLTVQVDSVRKPGHEDYTIPPNVRSAVNFYQTRGLIHGRSSVRAADPERTNIIGNFQMSYQDRQINCDNYPWISRHLNKPHHEIENDPRVWYQIASLIESRLSTATSAVEALQPPRSWPLK